MRNEFIGSILSVRAVEDTIRATRKYTKGAFKAPVQHPIQGEEFPSRVLTEYYEVYPDIESDKSLWDMNIVDAAFWLAGETPHIDVLFKYNYQQDKAIVIIHGGNGVVKLLGEGIPGFGEALEKVVENGTMH
jgi:hypothetical protein